VNHFIATAAQLATKEYVFFPINILLQEGTKNDRPQNIHAGCTG
jgi:hypothetical protein